MDKITLRYAPDRNIVVLPSQLRILKPFVLSALEIETYNLGLFRTKASSRERNTTRVYLGNNPFYLSEIPREISKTVGKTAEASQGIFQTIDLSTLLTFSYDRSRRLTLEDGGSDY